MTSELKLTIAEGKVTGLVNTPTRQDGRYGPSELTADRLRLDTVRTLKQWLERWGIVYTLREQHPELPVVDMFRILGEHLFDMLFTGDTLAAFADARRDAEAAKEPLKLLLTFAEMHSDLAALPWEFLYYRGDDQQFYLATQTQLALKRFVDRPSGRPDLVPVKPPLRVLVVPTVPQEDADGRSLADLLCALRSDRLTVDTAASWTETAEDSVEVKLAAHPHVVHLIGHARYRVGADGTIQAEVELPAPDGRFEYSDPDSLIELLTRGKSAEHVPRLVVLHLCETQPVLFTASFERLAPELIKAGVPAVVAMAYPMTPSAAQRFIKGFYERLAAGEELDRVVQETRFNTWFKEKDARLIGTPVLYMQADTGVLVEPEDAGDSQLGIDRHHVNTQITTGEGAAVRARMATAAQRALRNDPDAAALVAAWVDAVSWPAEPEAARRLVRRQLDDDPDRSRRLAYMAMLGALAGAA